MKVLRFILLLGLVISLTQCEQEKRMVYFEVSGNAQGTTYHIKYKAPEGTILDDEIEKLLEDFDLTFSIYKANSIISRINNNDSSVVVNHDFIEVFEKSQSISEKTDGAFDITVGPLVKAWGFWFTKKVPLSVLQVDSLRSLVNYRKISINGNKFIKEKPEMKIDFNAIAQGYSVDLVAELLEGKKIENYMVEIGGEVRGKGVNSKGQAWQVGIDKPIENSDETNRELEAIVSLNNKSLATSGSYRKFFEENGIKYSHTIDPITGYPAKHNLLSVTVMANDCTTADSYATAFMVMGLEKTKAFVNINKELEVYLIYSLPDGKLQTWQTKGFPAKTL